MSKEGEWKDPSDLDLAEANHKIALLRAVAEAAEIICDEEGSLRYARLYEALKAAKDGGAM